MTMSECKTIQKLPKDFSQPNTQRVFVHDLILSALIGVHSHEKNTRQLIRINLDMEVSNDCISIKDQLSDVVNYEDVIESVKKLVAEGHINLVETLAEKVAQICLADKRVHSVKIQIAKINAFEDAGSVGVEICRGNW
ncbi:MAG: dihydroneopterin aldolase [Rhodospirillaceae bacterium]|nr:dihydroneopterin aldolase [Rhodospirillaceae bacterium]|tara:strand:- start:5027 stop:5440 length:414 start_codon:yes stop_codon:yes gene_type:complete